MPPEQPRSPLDALQAQVRDALEAHLTGLSRHYDAALTAARQDAAEAAERTIDERLERAHAEWARKADAEVAAVREEAERRLAAETTKARVEAEQQAAESLTRVRAELDAAVAAERQHADDERRERQDAEQRERADLEAKWRQADADHQRVGGELDALRRHVEAADADRRRAEGELDQAQQRSHAELEELRRAVASLRDERQRLESDRDAERRRATEAIEQAKRDAAARLQQARDQATAQLDEVRRHAVEEIEEVRREAREEGRRQAAAAAPATAAAPGVDRIVHAVREIDAARTLSEALEGLLRHASSLTARAALFLVNGDRLRSWKTKGFPQLDAQPFESAISGSGLLATAVQTGQAVRADASQPPPTFAAAPQGSLGVALPIIVGGRSVAVLYADNVGDARETGSWPETLELISRHASTVLALLTALKTVQTLGAANGDADEQSARRYAKLLVSEIKLYNEAAVKAGRERRDLLSRLRTEIDRARRLYEERVPAMAAARGQYFQQELVQTLADGDPGLLGPP